MHVFFYKKPTFSCSMRLLLLQSQLRAQTSIYLSLLLSLILYNYIEAFECGFAVNSDLFVVFFISKYFLLFFAWLSSISAGYLFRKVDLQYG